MDTSSLTLGQGNTFTFLCIVEPSSRLNGFRILMEKYVECLGANKTLYLRDYDAYRHEEAGLTLKQVLENPPRKKCGHAFVLAMMLTQDKVLHECQLP